MISARDELLHLIDCLSNAECEQALALLEPLSRPHEPRCPCCGEREIDCLVWQDDTEHVACESCGFVWNPDEEIVNHATSER